MANIVCDICGGNIKMQANRTGVCQNCGMEYDIEAIRAMAANGASTPAASPVRTAAPSANDNEVSREALLIYLDDLRTAETILSNSNKKKNELSNKKQTAENEYGNLLLNEPKEYTEYINNHRRVIDEKGKRLYRDGILYLVFGIIICVCLVGVNAATALQDDADSITVIIGGIISLIVLGAIGVSNINNGYKTVNKAEAEIRSLRERHNKDIIDYKMKLNKKDKERETIVQKADTYISDLNSDIA